MYWIVQVVLPTRNVLYTIVYFKFHSLLSKRHFVSTNFDIYYSIQKFLSKTMSGGICFRKLCLFVFDLRAFCSDKRTKPLDVILNFVYYCSVYSLV